MKEKVNLRRGERRWSRIEFQWAFRYETYKKDPYLQLKREQLHNALSLTSRPTTSIKILAPV
jgi:hypothetical protein